MTFEEFCRAHDLIVDGLHRDRWVAVPTVDHPRKRNGRYKWMGDFGWVQNWATMQSPSMWRREGFDNTDRIRQEIRKDNQERQQAAQAAASRAAWIMHQTRPDTHPYLERKGFPQETGAVWHRDGHRTLVIPMRLGNRLVGCQLIAEDGTKKFLQGQMTKGASFVIDARGLPIFCEGYATGLSIRAAMKASKVRYRIFVCFSASNLQSVAREVPGGIVVADNDANGVGETAARDSQKPYWMSETVGEDFNDYHLRVGVFHASQSLKAALFSSAAGTLPRSGEPALA